MESESSAVQYSVSVVIPSYGRPDKLANCVRALRRQTFSESWEIIVVDDGSPRPLSTRIIEADPSESSLYPQIQILYQSNAGPAAARNRGVRQAKGALIAFIDDDCIPDSNWLTNLVSSWRRRCGSLVGGRTINGLRNNVFSNASQTIVTLVYEHYNTDIESSFFFASNNILCSQVQFLEIGGFAEDFPRAGAEDRDFCDRWRIMGWPINWEKDAIVKHYHHQDLWKYIGLHIRYGRGAYIYQYKRMLRGSGSVVQDFAFHRRFPRLLSNHARREQWARSEYLVMIIILVLWQLANAYGFAFEWIGSKRKPIHLH